MKTLEELKKINTKNLLRLFRSERKRMFESGYKLDVIDEGVDSSPIMGWHDPSHSEKFYENLCYLNLIKMELDIREHVSFTTRK